MESWVTAVILAVQFIVIVVMTIFVIREVRKTTWEDIFRAWRRSAKPTDDDAKGG